jgi:hypothetical protein
MAVIGKVAGSMLRDNLVRNGVDLTVDTNLTYFDVNNRRVGINTTMPTVELEVNGNIKATSLSVDNLSVGSFNLDNSVIGNLSVTDSLTVPLGTNSYPISSTNGQIRYNTVTSFLEYYDGTTWNKVAKQGDLSAQITSDIFYGNNTDYEFTLTQESVTQGTFVSINGILQQPGESYVVTGNLLSFVTEIPVDTDVIEARVMTTNSQVGKIQNGSNRVSAEYQSDATGIVRISVDANVAMQVTSNAVTINNALVLHSALYTVDSADVTMDSFNTSLYRSAKYIISGNTAGGDYHSVEALVIHNGSIAQIATYANVFIGGAFLTLGASVLSGQAVLKANSNAGSSSVRISRQYLPN